jgi:hypothetical protein
MSPDWAHVIRCYCAVYIKTPIEWVFSIILILATLTPLIYNSIVAEIVRWNDTIRRIDANVHLLANYKEELITPLIEYN